VVPVHSRAQFKKLLRVLQANARPSHARRGSAVKQLNENVARMKHGKSPFSGSQPRPAAADPLRSLERANPDVAMRLRTKR
jgi:hypothetical protein